MKISLVNEQYIAVEGPYSLSMFISNLNIRKEEIQLAHFEYMERVTILYVGIMF